MKIAILQSNYLPWTGVFELINSVDANNKHYVKIVSPNFKLKYNLSIE